MQEHLKKAFNNDFPPPSKKIQSTKKVTIPSIPIDMPSSETNTQNALDVDRYQCNTLCYLFKDINCIILYYDIIVLWSRDIKSKVDEISEIEILNLNKKIDLNLDSKLVFLLLDLSILKLTRYSCTKCRL